MQFFETKKTEQKKYIKKLDYVLPRVVILVNGGKIRVKRA